MRFLADERCDVAAVRALRAAGHDVTAVVEQLRGADDDRVLALAVQEGRVVLTEDAELRRAGLQPRPPLEWRDPPRDRVSA